MRTLVRSRASLRSASGLRCSVATSLRLVYPRGSPCNSPSRSAPARTWAVRSFYWAAMGAHFARNLLFTHEVTFSNEPRHWRRSQISLELSCHGVPRRTRSGRKAGNVEANAANDGRTREDPTALGGDGWIRTTASTPPEAI